MSFLNSKTKGNHLLKNKLFPIFIISLIFLVIRPTNESNNKRNLYKNNLLGNIQFNSKSIFYNPPFAKNNVTGTGDIMQDVPYKALCLILNCQTGCCVGELDNISCGDSNTCNTFTSHVTTKVVVPAVIIPVCIILFITLMMMIFLKRNEYSILKSFILAFLCIFIITIPYILYYSRKKSENLENSEFEIIVKQKK
jgi:L-asparagine transporter-like permease